jgi:hypothetical protein
MLVIYGKNKGDKKFRPFDTDTGMFLTKLIHVPMFNDDRREEVDSYVTELNELNPDMIFEVRENQTMGAWELVE